MIAIQFPEKLKIANGWTSESYRWVRILFGIYLTVHFVHLMPWAAELFSNQGSLPDALVSPFAKLFPNVLTFFDAPIIAVSMVCIGALASIAFGLGIKDRWMAVLIWIIWASLFGRNPLIVNPSLAFVGWMLLFHAFLPRRDTESTPSKFLHESMWMALAGFTYMGFTKLSRRNTFVSDLSVLFAVGFMLLFEALLPRKSAVSAVPDGMYGSAWWVMAAGYSYSGYTKLISPSWLDGTAIQHVLMSPLARLSPLRDVLLEAPLFLNALTWSTLGLELLALPIAMVARARPWLWLSLVGLHLGIIGTVAFADLSVGMLMIHLVTFDPAWLKKRSPGKYVPSVDRLS